MTRIILMLLVGFQLIAQEKVYEQSDVTNQPEFPGTAEAFLGNIDSYFAMKIPGYKRGKYGADFIVEKDGTIGNLTVLGNNFQPNDAELASFQKTCPRWKPAMLNGKAVRCHIRYVSENAPAMIEHMRSGEGLSNSIDPDIVVPAPSERDDANLIYAMAGVEQRPEFPGGMEKFKTFYKKNFKVPAEIDSARKIYVTFVIEKDGSLTDIKVLRDVGLGAGKEAIRILKISPKWIPGKQNGKTVRVQYALPMEIGPETAVKK